MTAKKTFGLYCALSVAGILLASAYPLAMGVRVISDMVRDGTVSGENYPKYIIPYTPISLAVIVGVLLMPLFLRRMSRLATAAASAVSSCVFFISEWLLENLVIVTDTVETSLESWQMYMCYVPPEMYETRTWRAVDVLIGDYSPWFKLHFYAISILLILGLLNCFYGFGRMILDGDRSRKRVLTLQAVSVGLFLGLCILACFTAFYRDGDIVVSPLSAILMCLFFVLMGVTAGLFAGSFLTGKCRTLSVLLPAGIASSVTLVMYIGEMLLLSGNLYRFGSGWFFDGLGALVLAPADILVILVSGAVMWWIFHRLYESSAVKTE